MLGLTRKGRRERRKGIGGGGNGRGSEKTKTSERNEGEYESRKGHPCNRIKKGKEGNGNEIFFPNKAGAKYRARKGNYTAHQRRKGGKSGGSGNIAITRRKVSKKDKGNKRTLAKKKMYQREKTETRSNGDPV